MVPLAQQLLGRYVAQDRAGAFNDAHILWAAPSYMACAWPVLVLHRSWCNPHSSKMVVDAPKAVGLGTRLPHHRCVADTRCNTLSWETLCWYSLYIRHRHTCQQCPLSCSNRGSCVCAKQCVILLDFCGPQPRTCATVGKCLITRCSHQAIRL